MPFENLDIHLGREICLDKAALVAKIVGRRRGGFCYELNGAFGSLLRALGYRVAMLAARVPREDGGLGPPFDHMALLVEGDRLAGRWLADVGWGRQAPSEPLRFSPEEQVRPRDGAAYRFAEDGGWWRLLRRELGGETDGADEPARQEQYRFTLEPFALEDFAAGCRYHQTSPESHFTRQRICTLLRPEGRITVSDLRLIETTGGERTERDLANEAEWREVLRERFRVELGAIPGDGGARG